MTESLTFTVTVGTPVEQSFALFANHIGDWWPLGDFGVLHDGTVAFEGDLLVERSGEQEAVWGEVIQWEPPTVLALTWHPGTESAGGTDIRIGFEPDGEQTTVTLVHEGWDRVSEPEQTAARYEENWPGVLARFVELAAKQAEADRS